MLRLGTPVRLGLTSPEGRGRIASTDAMRVRGYVLSWDRRPLTRRYAPTSPRRGEVRDAARPSLTKTNDQW